MKKIAILAFVFISGISVGAWLMFGGKFIGSNDVYSNSDTVCQVSNLGVTNVSGCTGGAWTTWNLETHTQIYEGFIYTTKTTRTYYKLPHTDCGYRYTDSNSVTSEACTMTRTDPGAPAIETTTENVPAFCEDC